MTCSDSVWPALQTPLADNISGKIIGVGLASMFRFWAYRRFVFKTPATRRSDPGSQRLVITRTCAKTV